MISQEGFLRKDTHKKAQNHNEIIHNFGIKLERFYSSKDTSRRLKR